MTRETDSSSSGSQGRGGPAYPSGTPPYGTRPFPSLHPQERARPAGAPAPGAAPEDETPAADEPKTETTLTTRIRINIPGSRPIPPVVMRTTVEDGAEAPAAEPAPAPAAEAAPEPEPGKEKEKKASDWFAPRKPVAAPPPGAAPTPLPGRPQDPAAGGPPAAGRSGFTAGLAGSAAPAPAAPGAEPVPGTYIDPFTDTVIGPDGATPYLAPPVGPRPVDSGPARGPHAPVPEAPAPYAADPDPFATQQQPVFRPEDFPAGVPRPGPDPFTDQHAPRQGEHRKPGAFEASPFAEAAPPAEGPFPSYQPPAGPAAGATQAPAAAATPPGGSAAVRPPAPGTPDDRVSGDTLVGGIPAVRPGEIRGPQVTPAPAPKPVPAPAKSAKPAKKGRSKVVLLGVAAGGLFAVAYAAGLLMDHAEVPKGTTVLGVDIGDKTKAAAVKTLDQSLGNRTTAPLTLTVAGHRQALKPSVAGLSIDTDATVRAVAHADYNPVSVIGSLFGGSREADPVIVVDEDKLKVALQSVAGRNSAGSDGMVRFAAGKAVAVPGKPSQSFDVGAAATQVAAAYRARAETGADRPVALAVTTAPPKVTQAELTQAVNGFGRTAMSGLVTVRADAFHAISFGPNLSLPKFLTMLPTPDGRLQPHIDLAVLKSLYGSTYDGVLLERGNGKKTAVTPQDIATALIPALRSDRPADRVVTLPNVAP